MQHPLSETNGLIPQAPRLGDFLDKLINPKRKPKLDDDPSRPFTPPPSTPSKEETEDDEDGPNFPMDPALA